MNHSQNGMKCETMLQMQMNSPHLFSMFFISMSHHSSTQYSNKGNCYEVLERIDSPKLTYEMDKLSPERDVV
jgi:hypothetical protein